MPPEDGDPAPKASSSAAFAATIAPSSDSPTPPHGTQHEHDSGNDATVAAPVEGTPSALPEVSSSHYVTEREIARGGMGKIVAAEDRRLGRRVALKSLLEPAGEQVTRFQREAFITARLQHPGIVPVYEAGRWPTGEPFFAMKLVSGRPLDKVIAEARRLEDRLAIIPRLAAACDAIAYAHSQRIIHRDLKPANVLVGDFGETVVIDWGLAKDLDAADTLDSVNRGRIASSAKDTAPRGEPAKPAPADKAAGISSGSSTLTVAGAVMGTPAYMAPEQARGEPLDQRADVFSLGAMLYHTLAGVPPYNARTATDVIAAAALGKIVPLREREHRAPPDLVAIVEHAMAPSPHDRYPHAGELADELRRFLTGQLVGAHHYTALQRVVRFVRRHRAAVSIAAIAMVGFLVGGTMAINRIVNARDRARREERIAVTRKRAAEHLIDYMFSDMKTRLSAAGRLDLLAGLGTEVKRYYATLSHMPGGMPREDEIRMAEAIQLIGTAEHTSGKPDQALATWREARARLVAVVGSDSSPASRDLRQMIARFDYETGRIFQERGKYEQALEHYKHAQAAYAVLAAEDPRDKQVLLDTADTHDRLGDLLRIEGKIDEAFEQYSEAKNEREKAASQGSGRVSDEVLALSTSHFKLASVYQNRGESGAALEEYQLALRLRETLAEGQPDNVVFQEGVLEVQREMAELQRQTGDEKAAVETYKRALPVAQSLVQRDPTNMDWVYHRGNMLSDLGFALIDSGEFAEGLQQLESSIEVHRDLVARDGKSSRYKTALSRSHTRAGDALLYLGRNNDGVAQYRLALDIRKELVDRDARNVAYRRSIAWSFSKLAKAFTLENDIPSALEAHEQALSLRQQLVKESPSQGGFKNELASSEVELGRLLAARDAKRAAQLVDQGISRARLLVAVDQINNEWKETLTQGLLAQAALAKARGDEKTRGTALDEALGIAQGALERAPQNAHWPGYVAEIQAGLAEHAAATGNAKDARDAWRRVRAILEPLARTGKLPAPRRPLLERALAQK
jgi:serine/threonine protein kinase/tetratricopeptide (TPR) repeat protein